MLRLGDRHALRVQSHAGHVTAFSQEGFVELRETHARVTVAPPSSTIICSL